MLIYTMMIMTSLILIIMLCLLNMISKKTFSDKEKNSPFECGFDPKTNSRIPFSLQFFLIAIIFLIFDVEIVLMMPMIKIIETSSIYHLMISSNLFIMILLAGLYHEWNQGVLKWLK
uniref:NADH dehydrogenase subunit 3 n=1 Tax=Basiprionota bisignata TaxID=2873934 RepID=UPI001F13386F|nr:NADH dehydrogenase subunit 3 [Basiprionota bisignata]UKS07055.1 NADH dehydrogenase subunit 3 [Basiprionota bisignata]